MIRTSTDGRVRVVTIDHPERRNALRPEDLDALRRAVDRAETPVTYLRGAGDAFCAGADLDAVAGLDRDDEADATSFARRGQRTAAAIAAADTVVVCGIDGAARGGGVELALSGRVLDADEALRTGLVSRVVDDPRAVADVIADGKPDALRTVKRRVRDRRDDAMQADAEAKAFAALVRSHGADIAASRTE
ncbi:enoyl-CoA hydratase/isomerase family protein [Halorubrum sp. Ea8]|uniref:enoyl-CoA hydratase/isomerase family protein n=1 Tax=Halorubrum sp. Ea8 TaxID=1383841 RepID=UPI000B99B4BF|nr:enoyl-CoA hydratase/isomerase family protein [Halorubrum sp. Ea8]OYR47873.1 enoyl-CoA hydratase [Halorubrum sp. Ea8]